MGVRKCVCEEIWCRADWYQRRDRAFTLATVFRRRSTSCDITAELALPTILLFLRPNQPEKLFRATTILSRLTKNAQFCSWLIYEAPFVQFEKTFLEHFFQPRFEIIPSSLPYDDETVYEGSLTPLSPLISLKRQKGTERVDSAASAAATTQPIYSTLSWRRDADTPSQSSCGVTSGWR